MRRLADNGLAALIGRPVVHTGADVAWVSSETPMAAAKAFDSDLLALVNDINNNDVFTYRQYEDLDWSSSPSPVLKKVSKGQKAPHPVTLTPEQKAEHKAFVTALSALTYDWWGISDGTEGFWKAQADNGRALAGIAWGAFGDDAVLEKMFEDDPSKLGFYKQLQIKNNKSLSSIGQAELNVISNFRSRLFQLRDMYTKMGYKLFSAVSPEQKAAASPWDAALTAVKWLSGAVIVGGVVYIVGRYLPAPHRGSSVNPVATVPASQLPTNMGAY